MDYFETSSSKLKNKLRIQSKFVVMEYTDSNSDF